MKKKIGCAAIALVLSVVLLLPVFAAGAKEEGKAQSYEWTFSHHVQITHPAHAVYQDFAARAAQKTNNRVKINIFGAGQMGGLRDNVEGTSIGSIDFALVDFGTLALKHPRAAVTALPFVFDSYDHVGKYVKSKALADLVEETAKATNVRVLAFGYSGFRQVYSTRPVSTPADMKGMKIRVPEITLWIDTFEAIGAIPTPIAYGELYTSMQTRVVDAFELPSESTYSGKLHEVCKFIANTGHIFTENHIGMNEKLFKSLPADIQKALREAAEEAYDKGMRNTVRDGEQKWIDIMLKAGLQETKVNKDAFKKAVEPVWVKYAKNTGGQDLIDGIRNLVK
jgi:tripartite ATP-independent transporter DctP family solute receptor